MKIGYFTERPYQDPDLMEGRIDMVDLMMSNGRYDPMLGADLYNRYLDEKIYAEEMGFDMLMLNEHHSTPFCMGGVMNVEASILARETSRAKIVLLGNVIPIWDDPLWLAETLATIDLISRGRLVSGWVRGTGRESVPHNAQVAVQLGAVPGSPRVRAQGVDDAGAVPLGGQALPVPVREPVDAAVPAAAPAGVGAGGAEQEHRRVVRQEPHPVHHAGHPARSHQAVVRLLRRGGQGDRLRGRSPAPRLPVQGARRRDRGEGLPHRPQVHRGSEQHLPRGQPGPPQPLHPEPARPDLPHPDPADRRAVPGAAVAGPGQGPADPDRGRDPDEQTPEEVEAGRVKIYEGQLENYTIITGTPKTVIPKIRHVLETLRPGQIFFWDGDGAMSHEDAMRSLKLMGEEVIPAVREMGRELELPDAFEIDPATNQPLTESRPPAGRFRPGRQRRFHLGAGPKLDAGNSLTGSADGQAWVPAGFPASSSQAALTPPGLLARLGLYVDGSADPEIAGRHIADQNGKFAVLADAHELSHPGRLIVQAAQRDVGDLALGQEEHTAEGADDIHRYGHRRWSEEHAGPPFRGMPSGLSPVRRLAATGQ